MIKTHLFSNLFHEAYATQTGGGKKQSETKAEGGGGNSTGVYPTKIDFDENGQWVRSSDSEFRLVSREWGDHSVSLSPVLPSG